MMQTASDVCFNNLFQELSGIGCQELQPEEVEKKKRRDMLLSLFHKIVFEWNTVADIDFDILDIDTMGELLSYVDEFAGQSCELARELLEIFDLLREAPRVCRKRRLL